MNFRNRRPTRRKRTWLGTVGAWAGLTAWGLFAVVPIVWLLLSVTKNESQLSTMNPFAFGSLNNVKTSWLNLYQFQNGVFVSWAWNSAIITGIATLLSFLVTIPAGYALGTLAFVGRRIVLLVSLALMLLPPSSMVLPLFLEMNALGLVGSRWSVILPLSVYPFGLYVAFIYFSTSISRELYDAARVDGCTELGVFLHVAAPLAKPIIGLVCFFSFIRCWNEYLLPFVMLSTDRYPLPVGLSVLASLTSQLTSTNPVQAVHAPTLLLATMLTMLPVVIGILLAQRVVIQGAGALGGALRE